MADIMMAQAKRDFHNGLITGADILQAPMSAVWVIRFRTKGPDKEAWLIDAKRHEARQFKTLDAAFAAVLDVGLKPEGMGTIRADKQP